MKPAATVTREHWRHSTLYKVTLLDGSMRSFEHAQHAADWLELHLPGVIVRWNLQ